MLGLENLFCWVPWLIKWVLSWTPTMGRLHWFKGGVKVSGAKKKELKHGSYWFIPKLSDVYEVAIVRQVKDLPAQALTTSDDFSVRVGGVIAFKVRNVTRWLLENDEPDDGLLVGASQVLREWVKARKFADVQNYAPGSHAEDELTKKAQLALGKDFGVTILLLSLTDFSVTSVTEVCHSGRIGSENIQPAALVAVGEEE